MTLMTTIMGIVLLTVGLLKVFDWKQFAINFAKYDLIAKRSMKYSYSYPVLELVLGAGFLLGIYVRLAALVLLLLMIIGLIGVGSALRQRKKVACACLGKIGHMLNIPLTKFTLVEDLVMGVMAVLILVL